MPAAAVAAPVAVAVAQSPRLSRWLDRLAAPKKWSVSWLFGAKEHKPDAQRGEARPRGSAAAKASFELRKCMSPRKQDRTPARFRALPVQIDETAVRASFSSAAAHLNSKSKRAPRLRTLCCGGVLPPRRTGSASLARTKSVRSSLLQTGRPLPIWFNSWRPGASWCPRTRGSARPRFPNPAWKSFTGTSANRPRRSALAWAVDAW